jgi:hypothetical protein
LLGPGVNVQEKKPTHTMPPARARNTRACVFNGARPGGEWREKQAPLGCRNIKKTRTRAQGAGWRQGALHLANPPPPKTRWARTTGFVCLTEGNGRMEFWMHCAPAVLGAWGRDGGKAFCTDDTHTPPEAFKKGDTRTNDGGGEGAVDTRAGYTKEVRAGALQPTHSPHPQKGNSGPNQHN